MANLLEQQAHQLRAEIAQMVDEAVSARMKDILTTATLKDADVRMACLHLAVKLVGQGNAAEPAIDAADKLASFVLNGKKAGGEDGRVD